MLKLRLRCLDCNEDSEIVSRFDEIMKINPNAIRKTIREKASPIFTYFCTVGNFLQQHSGHRIAIVNQYNEILIRGEFR